MTIFQALVILVQANNLVHTFNLNKMSSGKNSARREFYGSITEKAKCKSERFTLRLIVAALTL